MNVAFVTYSLLPDLHSDDKTIADFLSQRNINVTPVSWDDPDANWTSFDVLIIRSTWDYFERIDEFNIWIDRIEALGCMVLNPLSVVRWNSNKRYFDTFLKMGFKLPPFQICDEGCSESLSGILKKNGWSKAVVKPVVSGGSYNTWITETSTAASQEAQFRKLLKSGELIVQTFIEEIATEGELSLIFFNKQLSHTIQKKPKAGDFRVQTQFGGSAVAIKPPPHVIAVAKKLIDSIEEPLLYGRVDGVVTAGEFLLMELELIEPVLSVYTDVNACERFYNALMTIVSER